jgi:hypothetical protein
VIERLSGIDLAVSDLSAAIDALGRNFGLKLERISGEAEAVMSIGGAVVRLVAGPPASGRSVPGGEGMVGLWLEAQDVGALAASLAQAAFDNYEVKVEDRRRVLEITPPGSAHPWLFIFDRRV